MNVETYDLADISERFIAIIIDMVILGVVGGIFGISIDLLWGGGLLGFIVAAGYQWYFLTHHNGQTIGKMIMKIQVIKTDGTPISDAEAIIRYVGYLLNTPILFLGWLLAFFDNTRQGFHDKIANTYVVKMQ